MSRRLLLLLAAFTVLALTSLAGIATAATTGIGAQNRVWAQTPAGPTFVGLNTLESPCSRPSSIGSTAEVASGFCVAAEEGSGSLGSTGRNVPETLNEQLAKEAAESNPTAGTRVPITMSDARWPASEGWVKMAQNINGIEVHYVYNTETGAADDFKLVP